MNRRHLLNSATCLIPGVSLLQSSTKAAASFPGVSTSGEEEALLALRNTEQVVMELLHICLERIDSQDEPAEWQARLVRALDCIQSRLNSETEPMPLQITAFQMDCLVGFCQTATTGVEEKILSQALRLCDACHFSTVMKVE